MYDTSWTDVSYNPYMHYWTKDITIDPNDINQNTWYVSVFSGWGGAANDKGGLYKTINRGASWSLVFNSYRVESSTVDPVNPNNIYATTESEGLWFTSNGTGSNPVFVQQDAYNFMHPVRVIYNPADYSKIWVTSFGNGIKNGTVASIPLPVSSIHLTGLRSDHGNVLKWNVVNENGIGSYSVEKSNDGKTFKMIKKIMTTESSSLEKSYEHLDAATSNQAYYRILINDINSSGKYSNICFLNNMDNITQLKLYPNPTNQNINVEYLSDHIGEIKLSIHNISGDEIYKSSYKITSGVNDIQLPLIHIPSGIYYLSVLEKNLPITKTRFIIN